MKNYFFLAFNNLKRRKLRSWLTMIGIFIGIAAVVALISLGQGLQDYITGEFEKLGSDKIIIQPKLMGPPGSTTSKSLILTSSDMKVVEGIRGVKWVVGMVMKTGQVTFKDESSVGFIIGINPDDFKLLSEVQSIELLEGRQLKSGDKSKAVIGYNHAYGDIWKRDIEIGDTIQIEGIDFKIIGIYKKVGNPYDDTAVYISKDTLKELLNVGDEESQMLVKTAEGFAPEDVADNIKRKLRQNRNEKEDQETFNVQTSDQLLATFSSIFAVVQAVFVGIAGISLVVGGIGIMNTMYTAVIERTKEIGTMKAIGAKNSDIMTLFLIESGLLGMVGGIIGVIIGIAIGKGVEYGASIALGSPLIQASFRWYLIVGALAFSFIIGSLSGLLPAMQASKLKPADALRYE